jgi:hypothetical protein
MVSNKMELNSPLNIARLIISIVGQKTSVYWKKAMVPKSPIEHPIKHHKVLYEALFHVWWHLQSILTNVGNMTRLNS